MNGLKILALPLVFSCCYLLQAQDAKQMVQQAVNAELAADQADHSRWIFFEVDRKPKNNVVQWVAQTAKGDVTRVLKRNGQQVPESQQRNAIDAFVHDSSAQAKKRQGNAHDDQQATAMLKLLPVAFVWTEIGKTPETTTFHFKPNPNFRPPSWQARAFSAMEGDMTINNEQHRIQEVKGHLIHDVTFGGGLLGRLKKGGSFEVERQQTGPGVWQIAASHVHIQGHALIFKTISEEEDDVKTSFVREPDNVTLAQAASAVMGKESQGKEGSL